MERNRIKSRYYTIPFLYLILIAAFVYLHLTGSVVFNEQIGYITLKGESKSLNDNKPEELIKLSAGIHGFNFSLSSETPLWLYENTLPYKTELKNLRIFPDGLEIALTRDVLLRIMSDSGPVQKMTAEPVFTSDNGSIKTIRIPVNFPAQTQISAVPNIPITAFSFPESSERSTFFLTLPTGSRFDKTGRIIELTRTESGWGHIVFERAPEGVTDPFLYWFSRTGKPITEKQYSNTLNSYLLKAYSGWSSGRFRQASGTWSVKEGTPAFKESIAAAYMSEALIRGNFRNAYTQVRNAVFLNPRSTGLTTAPFFGRLSLSVEEQQIRDQKQLEAITSYLKHRDPKIFLEPGIVQFIVDRGPYSLLKELYALAEIAFSEEADWKIRIGLLAAYIDGMLIHPEIGKSLEFAKEIAETDIFSRIILVDNNPFLSEEEGKADILGSLNMGRLLINLGGIKNDPLLRSVGMSLIVSCLKLSDEYGFLPRTALIREGRGLQKQGTLAPEDIYNLISLSEYKPRQISLYSSLSPGSWIWTAAEITSLRMEREEYRIGLRFPEGETHHLVFQGIKPFQSITMYGINWKSDPSFESYSAGWMYLRDTETLLVKIRHRTEEEEFVIVFGRRGEEPAGDAQRELQQLTPAPAARQETSSAQRPAPAAASTPKDPPPVPSVQPQIAPSAPEPAAETPVQEETPPPPAPESQQRRRVPSPSGIF